MAGVILKFAMPERCVILLVEDDENDAFFVKRALTKLGFPGKIHHATDTDEAKRYMGGDAPYTDREKFPQPEIIVADSAVTVRDSGVEFLEWVRGHRNIANIPFIIFSGGVSEETRKRAEAAGVRKILTKASSPEDLLLRMRQVLLEFPRHCGEWLKD